MIRNSCLIKTRFLFSLTVTLTLSADRSMAGEKVATWSTVPDCTQTVRFDATKVNKPRLHNTFDVLFGDRLSVQLIPNYWLSADGRPVGNLDDFKKQCERTLAAAGELALLDLPGLEDYRRLKIDEMRDQCNFGEVVIRAHLGDPVALRTYTASAARCGSFVDALDGKMDLWTKWHEVVVAECHDNSRPNICEHEFSLVRERSNPEQRAKFDILRYGWENCSIPFLLSNSRDTSHVALEGQLRRIRLGWAFPMQS
jgi:hypothetical protein